MKPGDNGAASGFDEVVRRLLEEHGLSASELARKAHLKSRNSIFRILRNECGPAAKRAFVDALREAEDSGLTDEDILRLEQALEGGQRSERDESDYEDVDRLFYSFGRHGKDHPVRVNGTEKRSQPFGALLDEMLSGGKVQMVITGCCQEEIIGTIAKHLPFADAECDIQICHVVDMDDACLLDNIASIQSILFCPQYEAYCLEKGKLPAAKERMLRDNRILAVYKGEEGARHAIQLTPVDDGALLLTRLEDEAQGLLMMNTIRARASRLMPMKSSFGLDSEQPDYVAYVENLAQLEQGKTSFIFKQDLPFTFIDPDVLVPCMIDGLSALNFNGISEELKAVIEALYNGQAKRWKNVQTKKKPTFAVLTRSAMIEFAKTGCLSDHFYAIRAFSPVERVTILRQLLELIQKNPYFRIYFLSDEGELRDSQLCLFEGGGLLISRGYMDYNFQSVHREVLLEQEGLCERVKSYIMNVVLTSMVLPIEETIRIFEEMIEIAQGMI